MGKLLIALVVLACGGGAAYFIHEDMAARQKAEAWRFEERRQAAEKKEAELAEARAKRNAYYEKKAEENRVARERDAAVQMIQNYVEREEARLNEIVEEAKINMQMAEVDLKSFRDEVSAIEKAQERKAEVAAKQGKEWRESVERIKALLASSVLKRLASTYGDDKFAQLSGEFNAKMKSWIRIEDRTRTTKASNRKKYYSTMDEIDREVTTKTAKAKKKLAEANAAIGARKEKDAEAYKKAQENYKKLEELRKKAERLRNSKMQLSQWEQRELERVESQLERAEAQYERQKELATLSEANMLHVEATVAETQARRRGDTATMEKAEADDAADLQEQREKTYDLAARDYEVYIDRVRMLIQMDGKRQMQRMADAQKKLNYLRKNVQNIDFMSAADVKKLKEKIAADTRRSIDEGLQDGVAQEGAIEK